MHVQRRRALGISLQVTLRLHDHEVDIEGQVRDLSERADEHRPESNWRHEAAIHHVKVEEVCAASLGRAQLIGQPSEVSRQDRWREPHQCHAGYPLCKSVYILYRVGG